MAESDVVQALLALGFSLNEARAYTALVHEGPATGYEIALRAEIPRSAVYGVLRRLVKTGAARSIVGSPARFAAIPSPELLELLRKRFDASTAVFENAVRQLDIAPGAPEVYSVRGFDRVLEEAERVARTAQERLVISGGAREITRLSREIDRAAKRKVRVVVFSRSPLPPLPAEVFTGGAEERAPEGLLVVVADDVRSIIAASDAGTDDAVVGETRALARAATSHVALEILLGQRKARDPRALLARLFGAPPVRTDAPAGKKKNDPRSR